MTTIMGARSLLGIDLRVTSVKVVEIDWRDSGFSLNSWGMTELPYQLLDKHPELEDAKADSLKKLLQSNQLHSREAIVVVGGSDTFVKLFSLPKLPRAEASEALKWKLAEEIPFPIEEALFDFYPIPKEAEATGKVDYLTACVHRKLYLEAAHTLAKAGVKLVGLTVLPDAIQELYRAELVQSSDKITSIIYMGKRTTNISIFRQGEFEFNRELNIGGENISHAMSGIMVAPEGRVELSGEEAERIKVEYGIPVNLENFPKLENIPLTQLQAMVRPALEKIQSEIARTFEYYKGQTGEGAVNKILLTGGSSLTPHLKEFLSEALGIPITTPEPLPKLNPRLSAALGAALSGGRRLNLLPEEVKHRWKLIGRKFLQPRYLASTFSGALALVYLFFWLQAFLLQHELAAIQKKMDFYRPRIARLDAIERSSKEQEQRKLTMRTFENKRTKVFRVFEEVSRLVPESAALSSFNLNGNDIHFWGIVFRQADTAENLLSRFVLRLSTSPLFEGVGLVQAAKNNGYGTEAFDFEISGRIREN